MSELQLRKDGVERVSYKYQEGVNDAVASLAEAWEAFRLLPLDEKLKLKTNNLFDGVGYEYKVNDSISSDLKENFDFAPHSVEDIWTARGLNIAEEAYGLIEAFDRLSIASQPMLENFWYKLGPDTPLTSFDEDNRPRWSAQSTFLRALYYPSGAELGDIIAEPHTDHSGGTTHFYESTDGCEMLTIADREWQPMPINDHEGVRFGGMQTQLESQNEIKALCHRVIANETTVEIGRSAIVGFMPLSGAQKYDKKTHGRLQEKEPGFNYDLSLEELKEYFTH